MPSGQTNDEAISICFLVFIEKEIALLMSFKKSESSARKTNDVAVFLNDKVEQGNEAGKKKVVICHSL